MAISRKGARKIEVAGQRFIWRIPHKGSYCQNNAWSPMSIAVGSASGRGSKLVLKLDVVRPDAWMEPSNAQVTPADVARFVAEALADGWQPERDGKAVVRQVKLQRNADGAV